ncbi:MAG: fatty acid hydroxylase, partial [Rubrivivax sp.]
MIDLSSFTTVGDVFGDVQQWLFETLVQPAVYGLGMGNLLEDAYEATGWLMVGFIQLAVLLCVLGPLQRWRPVEPVSDRAAVRVDMVYT